MIFLDNASTTKVLDSSVEILVKYNKELFPIILNKNTSKNIKKLC